MKTTSTKYLALFLLLGAITSAHAASVTTGNWSGDGADVDNTFTANGSAGFTELYGADSDAKYDSGASANFTSDVTLDVTNNTLQFSFTVGNITSVGGSNNAFRVGFRNNDDGTTNDATVHYTFGYGDPGDRTDGRFAGNSGSSNVFSSGTQIGATGSVTSAVNELFTGNTANLTVTLIYLSDAGAGLHNYQAEIDWDGETISSSTFTRNTDTWDGVYVNTNNVNVNIASDTYTVSGASVSVIPEPSSAAALLGFAVLMMVSRRRR